MMLKGEVLILKRRQTNQEIRELIKTLNLTQWEAGELLKLSESSFSRLLRKELTTEHKSELMKRIQALIDANEVPKGV